VTEPAPADLAAMKADPKIQVISQAGMNIAYLAMNVKRAPFDRVEVRQAMNYAINKKALIDAIYLGNAKPAINPMPPTLWSYDASIADYEYNPEKAKALLKKAGFKQTAPLELWTMPVSRPYNPNGKKMGELMQADLAKVGVQVKLVTYDWPTYLSKSKEPSATFDFLQLGWSGDNGDPDNFLNVLLGCSAVEAGGNRAKWCNKAFDDLIQRARRASNLSERTVLYKKAQKLVKREAPWVTLAHSTVYRAMGKNVTGYRIDPFGGDGFYAVDLK
jgi:dipeptide transport system substrate-binding protein